ncbi:hypothetical protein IW262DRAFT_1061710 [Armillaria fumosa]|nr:hypothetical protein IW262DRAFT_1061710 [Armillaria fumosa]
MGTNPNEPRRLQNSTITTTAAVLPTSSLLTVRDTADDSSRRIAIIGATIGGVVFCVVLPLFLIVFWRRARCDRKVRNNVEDAIDPMTMPNPNPLLSEPILTQVSRSPSPSAQTGTMSISTVESDTPDPGPISGLLRRPPQSSRIAYEEMIEWLQRQIRHMDGEGIVHSTSPAPPSYHSLR